MDGAIDGKFRREDLYALIREASKKEHGGHSYTKTDLSIKTEFVIIELDALPVNDWNLNDVLFEVDKVS